MRAGRLRAAAGLFALLLLTSLSRPVDSAEQRAFVTLQVAGLDQGETVALIESNDILIPVSTLEQAGVHGFKGTRTLSQSVPYVSLASLAPGISYKFDLDALSLAVSVTPTYLGGTTLDLRPARPPHVEYTRDRSAYLNYSVTTSASASDAFLESGYNWGTSTFYNSLNLATGSRILRGLTYVQTDDRLKEISRTYGDVLAQTGELGGSVFLAGFSGERDFDLDPYVVHFPEPTVNGAVTAPAVADVYVNGLLVRQVDLPPGSFNLANIPATSGNVNASVVVTDAFGHVQTFSQSYYSSTDVLQRGTSDFQYNAGLIRQNAFGIDDRYGPAALMGTFRRGASDQLTLGGRFEASAGLLSGGPSVDLRLPVGLFHAGLALSHDFGLAGGAFSLGYSYMESRFGFAAELLEQSPYYANVSQAATVDRTVKSLSTSISMQAGRRQSLAVQVFRRESRDNGTNTGINASDTIQFHSFSLTLTGTRSYSTTAGPQTSIDALVNFTVGKHLGVAFTHQETSGPGSAGSGSLSTAQLQESSNGPYGASSILNLNSQGTSPLSGTFSQRTPYGDASVDYELGGGSPFTDTFRVSGGLGLIGGGIYPMRPDNGAFALVEVPGVRGVHVFVANEDVGKTNAKGNALVAGLLPYYGNTIRIEDDDAALNDSIQTVQRLIAPPNKAGAIVVFPVQRLQALVGKVHVTFKGKPIVPSFGELDLSSASFKTSSAIGENGEFYLENVPAGKYAAHVLFKEGSCSFSLESPKTANELLNLGTLECVTP